MRSLGALSLIIFSAFAGHAFAGNNMCHKMKGYLCLVAGTGLNGQAGFANTFL